jgi:ethanolamine permease
VVGADSPYYHLLVGIGVFGLVASFHGLLLAAARASYELGRLNAPWLGTLHPRTQTPIAALIFNMGIGVLALLTGHTGEIIIVACFGALSLYVISMLAFFQLRRSHGSMHRPYRSPGFPWLPALALVLAAGIMLCMVEMYLLLFGVYLGLVGVFLGLFWARGDTQKVIRAR